MEGQSTRLLGKLMECCSSLFSQIDNLRKPRPVAEWAGLTAQHHCRSSYRHHPRVGVFNPPGLRVIDEMEQAAGFVDCKSPLPWMRSTSYLNGRFEIAQGSTQFGRCHYLLRHAACAQHPL